MLGRTDRFARRLARNIQIVCQEESNLGRVTDPAGGSWYVESLTDDLARKAWELFQEIERRGGMAAALQAWVIQDEIARTAKRAKAIATGRIELTGVSTFPLLGDDGITVEPWPKGAAASPTPAITVRPLRQARLAEPFEALRDAADATKAPTGHYPQVFLASLGAVIDHNTRSRWVANFLATGGIEALTSDGYTSPMRPPPRSAPREPWRPASAPPTRSTPRTRMRPHAHLKRGAQARADGRPAGRTGGGAARRWRRPVPLRRSGRDRSAGRTAGEGRMNETQAAAPPRMTVDEFLAWDGGGHQGKLELVDGLVRAMAPASATHAMIQGNLILIGNHLCRQNSLCE